MRLPLWPLVLPLHGVLLVFLFTALHECVHRTAFAKRALSDTVAAACGAVPLLSPERSRRFRFAHHRHARDPARGPELVTPLPRTWREYLVHVSGVPLRRAAIATLLVCAAGRRETRAVYVPATACTISTASYGRLSARRRVVARASTLATLRDSLATAVESLASPRTRRRRPPS